MIDLVEQRLGNYRLIQLFGQGSWASVYLGQHIHLNTQAALKVLHGPLAGHDVEAFLTEARTIAHLRHPFIVQVLDFGVEYCHHGPEFTLSASPGSSRVHRLHGTRADPGASKSSKRPVCLGHSRL